jgi:hypothetical protein
MNFPGDMILAIFSRYTPLVHQNVKDYCFDESNDEVAMH